MIVKLFRHARIFSPIDTGNPAAGAAQGRLSHFENGALVIKDGLIESIGSEDDVLAHPLVKEIQQEIDCENHCLIPGFVDPHTHMCFAGLREAEFEERLAGTPYLEILEKGGGILSTVRAVRAAGEDALYNATCKRVTTALQLGTTTLEIKSGYGLDTQNELKMLRVIARVGRRLGLNVVATFLGAHAVPEEYRRRAEAYVDLVIQEMLPAVAAQGIARYCDVFCEKGVFSVDQSRRLLCAAAAQGLGVKLHADEVNDLGGAGLAAELGAVSADHLLAATDVGLARMARAGVVAVLLPATAYSLRKPFARGRQMIDAGLAVALATDCNPGSSFIESMPFVVGLAVLHMHLTPAEALTAATLNAAYAVGMAGKVGSLEAGKQADLLLLDGDSPAILAYHAGVAPVARVYKRGERIL
jgi:imidazolonepropionase